MTILVPCGGNGEASLQLTAWLIIPTWAPEEHDDGNYEPPSLVMVARRQNLWWAVW